jgi:hypothetical protein
VGFRVDRDFSFFNATELNHEPARKPTKKKEPPEIQSQGTKKAAGE